MGDDRGSAAFGYLLEALVAIALLGTFLIYGNAGQTRGLAPDEVAKLAPMR